jgi:hypothetical protein
MSSEIIVSTRYPCKQEWVRILVNYIVIIVIASYLHTQPGYHDHAFCNLITVLYLVVSVAKMMMTTQVRQQVLRHRVTTQASPPHTQHLLFFFFQCSIVAAHFTRKVSEIKEVI